MTVNRFNPQELCSRKLWELVSTEQQQRDINAAELREAVKELAERSHYLAQLTEIGKLGGSN